MAKRFLIIQTAFLGDVILSTPVVSELKRLYPNALIDIVVRKSAASLVKNHKDICRVIEFDKSKSKLPALRETISQVRHYKYDEIINLQRYFSSGLITLFAKGQRKLGFKSNPLSFFYNVKFKHEIGSGIHEVERNLETIAHHGDLQKVRPSLYPSDGDYERIKPLKKEAYYCIAPASIWFTKQLPKEKWVELVNGLNAPVYILGAPTDQELAKNIIANCNNKVIQSLCGELSLLQSAALMEKATMNFVNDSGPLHLASSVNAPVVAFFCSTIPEFGFGPLSDKSYVIQTEQPLNCKPCGIHGHKTCPKEHFKCGETIEINKALSLVLGITG